jgi:hypothetical protein
LIWPPSTEEEILTEAGGAMETPAGGRRQNPEYRRKARAAADSHAEQPDTVRAFFQR